MTVVHRFILQRGQQTRSLGRSRRSVASSGAELQHFCSPGILGPVHHVVDVVPIAHKVNAQQAGVAVGGVEGLEAVAEVLLHCKAGQAAAQVLREDPQTERDSRIGRGDPVLSRAEGCQPN